VALWALAAGQAGARPAIEVDLASTTAWTFRPDGAGAQAKTLPVPAGGWRLNGFPDATAGTYERRISIPKLPGGEPQVTEIAFEAVNWEATVYVGPDAGHLRKVGYHLSAWTPFRVDISRQVTPGQAALLRVRVRDRNAFKDAEGRFTVPAATEWNDRQARGILRGITLRVYPTVRIDDVFIKPSTLTSTLSCDVTLVNANSRPRKVRLQGRLSPWNPGAHWNYPPLPNQVITLGPNARKTVTVGPVKWTPGRAAWWWPNVPYRSDYRAQLHLLSLSLWDSASPQRKAQAAPLNTETVRFGFCTPGQQGPTYTLNGVRIHLRGDSLPEGTIGTDAFARLPGFLPPSKGNPGWPGAVRNYQRLNYNVLRMHQVPCTRYMMDVCDELGMLVIPETAIRGAGKPENVRVMPEAFATHLRELILRDRNHPSVFKWSLENELFGAPEAFLRQLYETCMTADGTRPCSIDDNADYPSWPKFAVIEHYSQPPGTPDAAGGHARADRPFGQGEYIWPQGATPSGALWWALTTRSLRRHDNADIRSYTLIDVWPGVIPGLTPTNFPDPHLPPDSLEQGGRSLLNPQNPWDDSRIQLIQRSFAPVAIFDPAYNIANTPSNGRGEWPAILPTLPAGQRITQQFILFNDEFSGQDLQLRILPVIHLNAETQQALPEIVRTVAVPLGGHVTLPVELPGLPVEENSALDLTLTVSKGGQERFREKLTYLVVPEGKAGTQALYEGRDDATQGNWVGVYGAQGFLIPRLSGHASFQLPGVTLHRGPKPEKPEEETPFTEPDGQHSQIIHWEQAASVSDPRVALAGPRLTERSPAAFAGLGEPLLMRVETTDGKPHRLSLYLLDYKREGRAVDVDILDLQGHRLDTRRVADFAGGAYLKYRFTGSVLIKVTSLDNKPPTLSGLFVDADSGDGLLWH